MKTAGMSEIAGSLAQQWRDNARLRLGLVIILAILWVYSLLLLSDHVSAQYKAAGELREAIARARPLTRDPGWKQRADEAAHQLAAAQNLLWQADNLGLAEASFQDWLRTTADKAHLAMRELNVSRAAETAAAASAPATAASRPGSAGPTPIRARMSIEFKRTPLLAFLAEVGQNEPMIVVDRLQIRTGTQPPVAELDLHVLAQAKAGAR